VNAEHASKILMFRPTCWDYREGWHRPGKESDAARRLDRGSCDSMDAQEIARNTGSPPPGGGVGPPTGSTQIRRVGIPLAPG